MKVKEIVNKFAPIGARCWEEHAWSPGGCACSKMGGVQHLLQNGENSILTKIRATDSRRPDRRVSVPNARNKIRNELVLTCVYMTDSKPVVCIQSHYFRL
jgi:hypothetical protein